jgi:hypothetical protein
MTPVMRRLLDCVTIHPEDLVTYVSVKQGISRPAVHKQLVNILSP